MISPNSRVTVAEQQLHGNQSLLQDGQVIAIEGSHATVQLDNEIMPRKFPTSSLTESSEVYGGELTSQFDHSVIDAIRRY
jgi:hypothetical protein